MEKINYFYIDETGSISNNAAFFMHGCIQTDSPNVISDSIKKLRQNITESLYFEDLRESLLKKGFHATANSMDLRVEFYKMLPLLNYRAYFAVTRKDSLFFKKAMKDGDESDFFEISLKKLLHDRIISNKEVKNIFFFETIQLSKRTLKTVLESFFKDYQAYDIEYKIVGKEEENLAVVDYLNFIFDHIFTPDKMYPTMEGNLKRVSAKIGIVKMLHNNVYLSRNKPSNLQITLKNLIDNY